jgi:pyrroline-5-carboxylate reductase
MMLKDKTIAVVGVGKIGGALIAGLLQSGMVRRDALAGSTGHGETARRAAETYGIPVLTDNRELVRGRDIIILAVKPQNVRRVLTEVRDLVTPEQLVITLAAATPTARIEEILERPVPVVRAMPNMPCLVQKGMTVLCPGRHAREEHVQTARAIFQPLGRVEVIDNEDLMDAVTALSGSGPAYAYIIIESLAEGGVKVGLPRELATVLAAQSLLGAAAMVLETREHPARLKDEVTTPAGVTIDGIMELEDGGIRVTLIKAVDRATRKSKELSRAHGGSSGGTP